MKKTIPAVNVIQPDNDSQKMEQAAILEAIMAQQPVKSPIAKMAFLQGYMEKNCGYMNNFKDFYKNVGNTFKNEISLPVKQGINALKSKTPAGNTFQALGANIKSANPASAAFSPMNPLPGGVRNTLGKGYNAAGNLMYDAGSEMKRMNW